MEGKIIAAWKNSTHAHLAISVEGDNPDSSVEYIGAVPLEEVQGLSEEQEREVLVQAAKAERERSLTLLGTRTDLGHQGTVAL